jgi:glycerol-3-phosphate acyltransferase PlsY
VPETIAFVVAYLVGSVMLAVPISRALGGVDIRTVGSGNPGFTNVLRSVGRTAGLLTLAADVGKGVLAVLAARAIAGALGADPVLTGAIACAGAILGHAFPVFFRFRGGKGVATAAGGFVTLIPVAALVAAAVWTIVLVLSRYMSAASIAGALTLPVYLTWVRRPSSGGDVLLPVAWIVAIAIVLLHRGNLARLARGEERKFSLKRR